MRPLVPVGVAPVALVQVQALAVPEGREEVAAQSHAAWAAVSVQLELLVR